VVVVLFHFTGVNCFRFLRLDSLGDRNIKFLFSFAGKFLIFL